MATTEAKIKLTAEDATSAAFGSLLKNVANVKNELTGLPAKFTQVAIASAGIGSIAGFASMIAQTIEGRAKLRDLAIQSNISVEALSGLAKIGKQTDTSIEDVASASNKLSKSLFSQTEDSKGAAQAIQALGLNFDKFKSLQPEQQLYEVAKALDTFKDGSEKSAVAMHLFGRNGAALLPFLRELAQQGLQSGKVTRELAEQAYQYERNLRALSAAGDEWKKALADDMLPNLLEFTTALVDGKRAFGDWYSYILDKGTRNPFNSISEDLRNVNKELAEMARRDVENAGLPPLIKKLRGIGEIDVSEERRDLLARRDYLRMRQQREALDFGSILNAGYVDARTAVRRPTLKLPDATGEQRDALLNRVFQGELKLIRQFAEQQKEGYDFANRFLKGVFDDGLTTLSDYFAKQHAVRDAGVQAELESVDKEIAAAKKLRDAADKPETRQQAENAIGEATAKRARIVAKAAQDEITANQENERQVKQTGLAYYDFLASIQSLRGNTQQAFELALPKKIEDARLQFSKFLNPEDAKAQAEAFGMLLRQTDSLTRAQGDYARLADTLGLREKEIALDAQANGTGELDTLRAIGAERQKQLPLMQALLDRAVAEAQAIGSPEALLAAQRLQLTLKAAAAEASPLYMYLRDVGKEAGEAIANDAEQAITHWEGFRKLVNAIDADLVRIATRKLFTEPLGNFLTSAIGGNGQASGVGGLLGSSFLAKLFNPTAGGGFGTGAQFGNLDFGGFFAGGGTLQPGEWGVAGENGPERIYAGTTPVSVIANDSGSSAPINININVSMPAGTTRQTAQQAAAMIGDRVQSAMRRFR
jgi:hypothetical protein